MTEATGLVEASIFRYGTSTRRTRHQGHAMTTDQPLPDEIPCVLETGLSGSTGEHASVATPPDARETGHGRLRFTNLETVARLRARKLARIQWSRQPLSGFADGETPNFLS